jgi:CRP-like cAMP-binding protein
MSNPLLIALAHRDHLSPDEEAVVGRLIEHVVDLPAGADIVREGESPAHSTVMLAGLSARYNVLRDGKRQISALHMAGDFVDLHSLLLHPMDHSVGALTDCRIAQVPHELLREISSTRPHLTRMLWLLTTIDAAIFRKWLVASGHLPAIGQMAHFFCELWTRLSVVGLTDGWHFALPISQADLGDAMGISTVHVSRCLQELRRLGLMEWRRGQAQILDWDGLADAAEFDPSYLNLTIRPR